MLLYISIVHNYYTIYIDAVSPQGAEEADDGSSAREPRRLQSGAALRASDACYGSHRKQ